MILIFHLPYGSLTSASLISSLLTQLTASGKNVSVDNVFDIWLSPESVNLKGTSVFASDFSGLPCLLQLKTRSYLSDYRKNWNTERWKSFD